MLMRSDAREVLEPPTAPLILTGTHRRSAAKPRPERGPPGLAGWPEMSVREPFQLGRRALAN